MRYARRFIRKGVSGVLDHVYFSGHHSVFEHATLKISIDGISRGLSHELCEEFLYSTEQQSQRFVKIGEPKYYLPKMDKNSQTMFKKAIEFAWDKYGEISDLLKDAMDLDSWEEKTGLSQRKLERILEHRAIEMARYILPIATQTSMIYTINFRTWMRINALLNHGDFPTEKREFVNRVNNEIAKIENAYSRYIPKSMENIPEKEYYNSHKKAEEVIARWRPFKVLEDEEEILYYGLKTLYPNILLKQEDLEEWLVNPKNNRYLTSALDEGVASSFGSILRHKGIAVTLELSHSASHQRIRNRAVIGTRQSLISVPSFPDYITPNIIFNVKEARESFEDGIEVLWSIRNEIAKTFPEFANYLLPNATKVRQMLSSDYIGWWHFFRQRHCLRAQEEIRIAAGKIYAIFMQNSPEIWKYAGAPCKHGECPEKEKALECLIKSAPSGI